VLTSNVDGVAKDFPVVCVGGSAGGLDAYTRLLRHLPADMGVAIVIVNHLRTVVVRYRMHLESRKLAPGTVNLRLGAVRRLAYEATDCGLLSPDLAAGKASKNSACAWETGYRRWELLSGRGIPGDDHEPHDDSKRPEELNSTTHGREDQIVAFLQTLTDGYTTPYPDKDTFTGACMTCSASDPNCSPSRQGNGFLIPTPPLPPCASGICSVAPFPNPSIP
jgi:CheB methylesterase